MNTRRENMNGLRFDSLDFRKGLRETEIKEQLAKTRRRQNNNRDFEMAEESSKKLKLDGESSSKSNYLLKMSQKQDKTNGNTIPAQGQTKNNSNNPLEKIILNGSEKKQLLNNEGNISGHEHKIDKNSLKKIQFDNQDDGDDDNNNLNHNLSRIAVSNTSGVADVSGVLNQTSSISFNSGIVEEVMDRCGSPVSSAGTEPVRSDQEITLDDLDNIGNYKDQESILASHNNLKQYHIDMERTSLLWQLDGSLMYNYLSKDTPISETFKTQNGNEFKITLSYNKQNDNLCFQLVLIADALEQQRVFLYIDFYFILDNEQLQNIYGTRYYEKDELERIERIDSPEKPISLIQLRGKTFYVSGIVKQKPTEKMPFNKRLKYIGLANQGNTCYMNSYLQTLFHLSEFMRLVLKIPTKAEPLKFPDSLQILANGLLQESQAQSTVDLCKSFGWDRGDAAEQQDVQEFSCNLIEALECKVDKHPGLKGEVSRLFQGQLKNFIRCKDVDYKSERIESFLDIQLQVKGMSGIYQSLKEFTTEELMNGDNQYDTDDPGQPRFGKQDAIKGFKFQKLPPILQITLKRFEFNQKEMRMVKILDKYEYPSEIDLQEFVDDSLKSKALSSSQFKYSLYAVLIHSGQKSGSGHYYVFIRKGDRWYKFNDKIVEPVSWQQVRLGGEGGIVEYPGYDEKDKTIKQNKLTKMETAYMLVYVQKSEEYKLLSDLTVEDVPNNVREQYVDYIKVAQEKERSSRYQKVTIFNFQDIAATYGNALLFQKLYSNSEVSLNDIQGGQSIEVSKSISVEGFLKELAKSLNVNVRDLIVFKLYYNDQLQRERLVNITQLLDFSADKFNFIQFLNGKGDLIDPCLLILPIDPTAQPLKFDYIKEISNEQGSTSKNATNINKQQNEDKGKVIINKHQFVLFCKRLDCNLEDSISEELQSEVLEQTVINQLLGYVVVSRTESSLEECLVALADLKHIHYDEFLSQNRFYIEDNASLNPIIDIHSNTCIGELFNSRFYGVIVLEPISDQLSLLEIANRYYSYRQNNLGILFTEHVKSDLVEETQKALLTISSEYTLETLQRTIKEKFYENLPLKYDHIYFLTLINGNWEEIKFEEDSLVKDVFERDLEVRFAYDPNIKAQLRKTMLTFKYYLLDHRQGNIIFNRPEEQEISLQKTLTYEQLSQLFQNDSRILQLEGDLKGRIRIERALRRSRNRLQPTSVMQFQQLEKMQILIKYVCVLERVYNKENDYLIAGNFTDSENQLFGTPFLMVENKQLKLSELHAKLEIKLKNKKISKFADSDQQAVISKFEAILYKNDDVKKGEDVIAEDDRSLFDIVEDTYDKKSLIILQIKVLGIDLSTAQKKINS